MGRPIEGPPSMGWGSVGWDTYGIVGWGWGGGGLSRQYVSMVRGLSDVTAPAVQSELSLLPLVRLDFSCNHVTAIPRCFRRLRLLQALLCDHNPLQAPPPHVTPPPPIQTPTTPRNPP